MSNLDHSIHFKRVGSSIQIHVVTNLPHGDDEKLGTKFVFSYDCESTQYASLLLEHLRKRHCDSIKSVRMTEFKSGWKHGRAKKKGLKFYLGWFMSTLKPTASHS